MSDGAVGWPRRGRVQSLSAEALAPLVHGRTGVELPTDRTAARLDHLRALEAESIHIIREVAAEFERPVMLYSIGKDSSVLLRLAQKAFHPAPIPFPLLHVDTTYKFREMIEFRDWYAAEVGARLIVHTNQEAIADGTQPFAVGTQRCCGLLKTRALLDALQAGNFDAAFGGARRDEERSRAKERVFSLRDANGQWDPKRQRPELWHLLNSRLGPGESIRVFPLSNWTELDVWHYIHVEQIPVVPLYFAREREVIVRGNSLHHARAAVRAADAGRTAAARSCAACDRSAARPAPAPSARTPTRSRKSSRSSSRSGTPSASCASSITIRTARWR